jgi:hypothetical protein
VAAHALEGLSDLISNPVCLGMVERTRYKVEAKLAGLLNIWTRVLPSHARFAET